MQAQILQSIERFLPRAEALLCDLIALPTVSGAETPALERLDQAFADLPFDRERRAIPDAIKSDPDYSGQELGLDYDERYNLFVRRPGAGGRSLILQTHVDVVPAGEWGEAFNPRVEQGIAYGRGACDCKGQAASLWLAMSALAESGVELTGDLCAQFVIEEEIGGNGALAAILDGGRADAAVILEPTGMNVHPGCRGACWFRIAIEGRSVHMGRKHEGVNAIEKAVTVFQDLQEYEAKLVNDSKLAVANDPILKRLFERYDRPVQANIGMIRAGEWPSMVPAECVIEGGVGFLPNKSMPEVQDDLRRILTGSDDLWVRAHSRVDFPKLHNDAYAGDPDGPAVISLANACKSLGLSSEVFGWNVSCDARLYALRGNMPAIVFGPGDVKDAHSNHEQIRMADIGRAAQALAEFVIDWCGTA